jgi:hypothetical protein
MSSLQTLPCSLQTQTCCKVANWAWFLYDLHTFVLHPHTIHTILHVPTGTWKIIDFGLARRFKDESGSVLPQRADAAFRGSTTYASIHAHQELDLGRRDDLWSWLYCLVELLGGKEGMIYGAGSIVW